MRDLASHDNPPYALISGHAPRPSTVKALGMSPIAYSSVGTSQSPSFGGPQPNRDWYTMRIGLCRGDRRAQGRADPGTDAVEPVDPRDGRRPRTGSHRPGHDGARHVEIELLVRYRTEAAGEETVHDDEPLHLARRPTAVRRVTRGSRPGSCSGTERDDGDAVIGLLRQQPAVQRDCVRHAVAVAHRVREHARRAGRCIRAVPYRHRYLRLRPTGCRRCRTQCRSRRSPARQPGSGCRTRCRGRSAALPLQHRSRFPTPSCRPPTREIRVDDDARPGLRRRGTRQAEPLVVDGVDRDAADFDEPEEHPVAAAATTAASTMAVRNGEVCRCTKRNVHPFAASSVPLHIERYL